MDLGRPEDAGPVRRALTRDFGHHSRAGTLGLRLGRSPRTGPAGTDGSFEYEGLDIRGYEDVPALRRGLARSFAFSNHARLHQALGYRTPAAVHAMPVPCDLRLSLPASEG